MIKKKRGKKKVRNDGTGGVIGHMANAAEICIHANQVGGLRLAKIMSPRGSISIADCLCHQSLTSRVKVEERSWSMADRPCLSIRPWVLEIWPCNLPWDCSGMSD